MSKGLSLILKEQDVSKDSAKQLIEAFGAPFTEAGEILESYTEIKVTDVDQKEEMALAREKRLVLRKIRSGVENKRKELKADYLKAGKAIDAVATYVKETIKPAEEYLELQEKFTEIKKAEGLARKRAGRIEKITSLGANPLQYNVDAMSDETFEETIKQIQESNRLKAEAEKAELERLEKERVGKEAEEKRIREENARLRAEAEAKEIQLAKERKQREAKERAEREAREKAEAEAEAKRQAELEVERKKAEVERQKREAIELEAKKKAEAEARVKAEAEEAERQALLAPDKDKLTKFANALNVIRTSKLPAVSSNDAQQVVNMINKELETLESKILEQSKKL